MNVYTLIALGFIMTSLWAVVKGEKNDRENGFTNQPLYWTWYICGLIGLSILIGNSILSAFPTLNAFMVFLLITLLLFALTQHYVIVSGNPNLVFATADRIYSRKINGKKLYRLYEGRISLRLPWHKDGVEVDVYEKIRVEFSELTVEMHGVVLEIQGTAILAPIGTGDKIHAMLQTGLKTEERVEKISSQIKGALTAAFGDELIYDEGGGKMRFEDAESVMNNKSKYVDVVKENETLTKTCATYGYELENLVLSDIDESEDSSKAREQVAVARHLEDAIHVYLIGKGIEVLAITDEEKKKGMYVRRVDGERYDKEYEIARQSVLAAADHAKVQFINGNGLGDKVRYEANLG